MARVLLTRRLKVTPTRNSYKIQLTAKELKRYSGKRLNVQVMIGK